MKRKPKSRFFKWARTHLPEEENGCFYCRICSNPTLEVEEDYDSGFCMDEDRDTPCFAGNLDDYLEIIQDF